MGEEEVIKEMSVLQGDFPEPKSRALCLHQPVLRGGPKYWSKTTLSSGLRRQE